MSSKKLMLTMIDSRYGYSMVSECKIIVCKQTKYINATKLCQEISDSSGSKKPFGNWIINASSKKILNKTSIWTGINESDLMFNINGGKNFEIRGTYVHPLLITPIISWISPEFSVEISIWIDEWKNYSRKNSNKYWNAVNNIVTSNNLDKEKQVQTKLKEKYGGQIEVDTDVGKIDLLTKKYIIEIKNYENWKSAIGQLIMYSCDYPEKKKIIYLFDVPNDNILDIITTKCQKHDIIVKTICI